MNPSVPLSYRERSQLVTTALGAARQAAEILRGGYRTRLHVERKGRIDLVTEFDRASESHLRKELASTGIAFVGEEEGGLEASRNAPLKWFVDPLDGTTNFVHGHPYFCVSVGLVEHGVPIAGVVVAPLLGLEWTGTYEGALEGGRVQAGAQRLSTRNGESCAVSAVDDLLDALLATGFPYDVHTSSENNLDTFVSMMRKCQAIRRCGSAALDLCHVAEGTFDAYWERKLKPWDLSAGAAIVLGAGGTLSDLHGGPAQVLEGNLLASNGRLHPALIDSLREANAPRGSTTGTCDRL